MAIVDGMTTRTCTSCHAAYPLTREYFYVCSGRWRTNCKRCQYRMLKAWRDRHPNYHRDAQRRYYARKREKEV